jgi:cytochrome c oxidase assembly protein subunit 15
MVAVGGATRLTRSGLSMTEWSPHGSLPPMREDEWLVEFERYKSFPEFTQRQSMSLSEFKYIYFWEWGHRMLGRTLGVFYAVPLAYFSARRMIPRHVVPAVGGALGLGACQGLVGWWMVKSGLEANPNQAREIRVSPYRLSAHLGMAFTTFALLVHTGLEAIQGPARALELPSEALLRSARRLRGGVFLSGALGFATAMSGALVAGNDAGRAFNVFPKMTPDAWLPEGMQDLKPLWRNHFENTAMVQAQHRALAGATLAATIATHVFARGGARGKLWTVLPIASRHALNLQAAAAAGQVGLGIATLLLYVPVPLGVAHQFGALTVVGGGIWAARGFRLIRLGR